jgi:hypothetical protein
MLQQKQAKCTQWCFLIISLLVDSVEEALTTVESRSTTTSVTRPPRHDDQISPVPNAFFFNFQFH